MSDVSYSKEDNQFWKNIEGFRRLALSLSSVCISLGSFSLALLVYSKNISATTVPFFWLWLLQIAGIVFLFCSAFCIDWVLDSFSDEEWRAAAIVSPELASVTGKGRNQIFDRLTVFSTGYLLYAVACSALIAALIIDFGRGTTFRLFFYIAGAVTPMILMIKMLTLTLSKKYWFNVLFFVLFVSYGVFSFFLGRIFH